MIINAVLPLARILRQRPHLAVVVVRPDDNHVGGNVEAALLIFLEHLGIKREMKNRLLIFRQQHLRRANLRFDNILKDFRFLFFAHILWKRITAVVRAA